MKEALKVAVPLTLAALAIGVAIFAPPFGQPQAYHGFADTRPFLGLPNAADTLSNLAFLVVGILGLAFLARERAARSRRRFGVVAEMHPYGVLYAAVVLAGLGSAYYHLAPDDARLAWDRMPIALAFAALVSAVIAERIDARAGSLLLWPLAFVCLASVVYWRWSGNLTPYAAVQVGAVAVVLAVAALYRSPYTRGGAIFAAVALYGAAKAAEVLDREIFALGGWVSGHTLKHLFAAAGAWVLLRSLELRERR